MSVSLRKQRDKPSENRIFKKENKYGNLSIIHHSQRLPKGTFRTAWGGVFLLIIVLLISASL